MVGLLSRATHGQVHHNNSGHFRGNYQRVSLNNFPSLRKLFLQEKTRKRQGAGLGTKLQWSRPLTDTFKSH